MPVETIDTLVIGAGQAGVAMSEHLGREGVPHIVLEKSRIAERWRTGRWDSLVANGPAWHDRFPGLEFDGDGEAFPAKDEMADYFERYAAKFGAPIRCGVEATRVQRLEGRSGFRVETSAGVIEARNVVSATGPFQTPVIPHVVPQDAPVTQLHSADYRNPEQLPEGAVLVVGAGSSGAQIADELNRAGRKVYLSVGPHGRPPRTYRGRDYCWWLGVLGLWDIPAPAPGTEHVTIAVSGAQGGRTVEFRQLAAEGITLVGRTESYADGRLSFEDDLARNIRRGDTDYLAMLDQADAYVTRNGLDLPEEPEARQMLPDPDCMIDPLRELDLDEAGVKTILWATGYALDYGWLDLDVLDENGRPQHERGVSPERGFYFLGLPWLSRRGSSFIWGVWHDARYIADQIVIQRSYSTYDDEARRATTARAAE
ncbi:flavin-containing monooxygenase [Alloyangia pacifica]|uniref:Putative flavoprotein involved in K+ transport n=1 Tax=Alloyangia pacifica TaxID=311180 RepID=A0A1I6RQX2_9RHOB|nr:NAD(P)/FAD-dependent oxidoreductase [Alloyangia pacifica]SDG55866.1 putative flavoprotein involved in K+ transport [Alloyangia pacifica]SFS66858.1 putative flavoprotein involved in K+ transport [Alloyangia pacifica]